MTGGEPLVRVVRGEPDDFELAAVTVVVAALLAAAAQPVVPVVPEPRSGWADRSRTLGIPVQHAPGAWNS
ncbi:acyl-CoA carboxylase epsilon subunit [Amycolatopsis magusensis]|uniref:acyl-CoA carboxylase epsilon subunit n=1 Tax=Amycolatopsis magusensis TaxID=882444 RepID=UPI003C2E89E7